MPNLSWTIGAIAFVLYIATCSANAEVRGIRAKTDQPIAPRGSIMMLPLTSEQAGDNWPSSIPLELADGRKLLGEVAWIDSSEPSFERQWTSDPRQLGIRAAISSDDNSGLEPTSILGPYLLVRLPLDGAGAMQIDKQMLTPNWVDVPELALIAGDRQFQDNLGRELLPLIPAPDRPDPVSPFEYWRWVLLAQRMNMLPPRPFGGNLERMAGEYYAALWQVGIARLEALSPRLANECRNLLTRTCIDQRHPFAAWIADPSQLGALLSALVNPARPDAEVLSAAVTWIDAQPPLMIWPERDDPQRVRLAMVTSGSDPVLARMTWRGSVEPPVAVQIEPGVLMQVNVDRPPPSKPAAIGLPAPPEPKQHVLVIEAKGRIYEFVFGPRMIEARPPAVYFRALAAPMTLAEVQSSIRRTTPTERTTLAQVRKLSGRWEVFFECRRPVPPDPEAQGVPEEISSTDLLRGIEAVTVLIGPEGEHDSPPAIWITVPENGFWRVLRGVNDGTLQVHRKSFEDRWNCRIVLPDSWFSGNATPPAYIGVMRSHHDSNQVEIGPNVGTPWRMKPGRAALDLTRWDDVPPAE